MLGIVYECFDCVVRLFIFVVDDDCVFCLDYLGDVFEGEWKWLLVMKVVMIVGVLLVLFISVFCLMSFSVELLNVLVCMWIFDLLVSVRSMVFVSLLMFSWIVVLLLIREVVFVVMVVVILFGMVDGMVCRGMLILIMWLRV